MITKLYP